MLRTAMVVDLDLAVRRDIRGAFDGTRCDELKSLIDSTLEQDPNRLIAYYLRFVCAQATGTILGTEDAHARLLMKMAQTEQSSGEYFGDNVRKVSTAFDALAFAAASGSEILAAFFDVGGGGRRLYYVILARDPNTGMQQTMRFDISAFAAQILRAINEGLSPDAQVLAEDSPALLFVQTMMSLPDPLPATLVGQARFLSKVPGYSLVTPRVREALARAVAAGGTYARLSLGQSYLRDENDATAAAQAYAQFNEASKAGFAEADIVLSVMYERGVGVAKDSAAADQALKRAVDAIGRARTDGLLAQVFLAQGSRLYDEARGRKKLEAAARAGDAIAQNSLGIWCESRPNAHMESCVDWYMKASAQGFAIATRNLAHAYENGKGVPRDAKKAEQLYEKAAAAGYLTASTDRG